jgi:hypothetical protein
MREGPQQVRDSVVRALAKLSLILVLGVLGALFVGGGSAAVGTPVTESAPVVQQTETMASALDKASPAGLVLVGVIVAGGLGVLLVGAFKPARRSDDRELSELLRD